MVLVYVSHDLSRSDGARGEGMTEGKELEVHATTVLELKKSIEELFSLSPGTVDIVFDRDDGADHPMTDKSVSRLQSKDRLAFRVPQQPRKRVQSSKNSAAPPEGDTLEDLVDNMSNLSTEKTRAYSTPDEALDQAVREPLPDWWVPYEGYERVPGAPLEAALEQLLQMAWKDASGKALPSSFFKFSKRRTKRSQEMQGTKDFRWQYRCNKPWTQFKEDQQIQDRWIHSVIKLGGAYLDLCKMVDDHGNCFLQLVASDLAWGKELLQSNLPEKQIDPVVLRNIRRSMHILEGTLDSCVLPQLRRVLRCGMEYFHSEPDLLGIADLKIGEYARRVTDHCCGKKGPQWQFLQNPDYLARLKCRQPYERTAALYLNYGNNVGRDIEHWDSTALCSVIVSCDIFNITVENAAARGWLNPDTESLKQVSKGRSSARLSTQTTLIKLAQCVRAVRNEIGHRNVFDIDFHTRFQEVTEIAALLGGNVVQARRYHDATSKYFPAKNTAEEVQQYMNEYKDLAKLLTGEQSEVLIWMLEQRQSLCSLIQAPSGSGKTLVLVKCASNHLIRHRAIATTGTALSAPMLILVPSIGLLDNYIHMMRQELGDSLLIQVEDDASKGSLVRVELADMCQVPVVICTLDAFIQGALKYLKFAEILVDEGHLVFAERFNTVSRQVDKGTFTSDKCGECQKPHRPTNQYFDDVWREGGGEMWDPPSGCRCHDPVFITIPRPTDTITSKERLSESQQIRALLRENMEPRCRMYVFHDSSYQCLGECALWPDDHLGRWPQAAVASYQHFIKRLFRMPGRVRDQSIPFSQKLGIQKGMEYFPLQDEEVKGKAVSYFKTLTQCLNKVLTPASGLDASHIAVLELLEPPEFHAANCRDCGATPIWGACYTGKDMPEDTESEEDEEPSSPKSGEGFELDLSDDRQSKLERAQSKLESAQRKFDDAKELLCAAQEELDAAETESAAAQKDLEKAQIDHCNAQSERDLALAKATLDYAQSELRTTQDNLNRIKPRFKQAEREFHQAKDVVDNAQRQALRCSGELHCKLCQRCYSKLPDETKHNCSFSRLTPANDAQTQRIRHMIQTCDLQDCSKEAVQGIEWNRVVPNKLHWGSTRNFVGLERPVIIVLVPPDLKQVPMGAMYAAMTRCTFWLCIVYDGNAADFAHFQIAQQNSDGTIPHSVCPAIVTKVTTKKPVDEAEMHVLEMDGMTHPDFTVQAQATITQCKDALLLMKRIDQQFPPQLRQAAEQRMLMLEREDLVSVSSQLVGYLQAPYEPLRHTAAKCIVRLPVEEVSDLACRLFPLLESDSVVTEAVKDVILKLPIPEVKTVDRLQMLQKLLTSTNVHTQAAALSVLGHVMLEDKPGAPPHKTGQPLGTAKETMSLIVSCVSTMVHLLQSDVQTTVNNTLRKLPPELLSHVHTELSDLLKTADRFDTKVTVMGLLAMSPSGLTAVMPVLVDLMKSPDLTSSQSDALLKVLHEAPPDHVLHVHTELSVLLKTADRFDTRVTVMGLLAMSPSGLTAVMPVLVDLMKSPDLTSSQSDALLKVLHEAPLDHLRHNKHQLDEMLMDPTHVVKIAAVKAILRLPTSHQCEATPKIVSLLHDSNVRVRIAAMKALRKFPPIEVSPAIPIALGLLCSPKCDAAKEEEESAIIKLLSNASTKELASLLPKTLQNLMDVAGSLPWSAFQLVKLLEPNDQVQLLPMALNPKSPDSLTHFFSTVQALPAELVLPVVQQSVETSSFFVVLPKFLDRFPEATIAAITGLPSNLLLQNLQPLAACGRPLNHLPSSITFSSLWAQLPSEVLKAAVPFLLSEVLPRLPPGVTDPAANVLASILNRFSDIICNFDTEQLLQVLGHATLSCRILPTLVKSVMPSTSQEVRMNILNKLKHIPEVVDCEEILGALELSDSEARRNALSVLQLFPKRIFKEPAYSWSSSVSQSAVCRKVLGLVADSDATIRLAIIEMLTTQASQACVFWYYNTNKRFKDEFEQAINDPVPEVQVAVLKMLCLMMHDKGSPFINQSIKSQLKSKISAPDKYIQQAACEVVPHFQGADLTELIESMMPLLQDTASATQEHVIRLFKKFPIQETCKQLPLLQKCLQTDGSSPAVRRATAELFSLLPTREMLQHARVFICALTDPETSVSSAAIAAVKNILSARLFELAPDYVNVMLEVPLLQSNLIAIIESQVDVADAQQAASVLGLKQAAAQVRQTLQKLLHQSIPDSKMCPGMPDVALMDLPKQVMDDLPVTVAVNIGTQLYMNGEWDKLVKWMTKAQVGKFVRALLEDEYTRSMSLHMQETTLREAVLKMIQKLASVSDQDLQPLLPALVATLGVRNDSLRLFAIEVCKRISCPDLMHAFQALKNPDQTVRISLVEIIGQRLEGAMPDWLTTFLWDEEISVQEAAWKHLKVTWKHLNVRILDIISNARRMGDAAQQRMQQCLKDLPQGILEGAVPRLLQLMSHEHWQVRKTVVVTLTDTLTESKACIEVGWDQILPVILPHLEDRDCDVQSSVVSLLRRLPVPQLVSLVQNEKTDLNEHLSKASKITQQSIIRLIAERAPQLFAGWICTVKDRLEGYENIRRTVVQSAVSLPLDQRVALIPHLRAWLRQSVHFNTGERYVEMMLELSGGELASMVPELCSILQKWSSDSDEYEFQSHTVNLLLKVPEGELQMQCDHVLPKLLTYLEGDEGGFLTCRLRAVFPDARRDRWFVSKALSKVMSKLPVTPLLEVSERLVELLGHRCGEVRRTVLKILRKLPKLPLESLVPILMRTFIDRRMSVRRASAELLCDLPIESLSLLMPSMVKSIDGCINELRDRPGSFKHQSRTGHDGRFWRKRLTYSAICAGNFARLPLEEREKCASQMLNILHELSKLECRLPVLQKAICRVLPMTQQVGIEATRHLEHWNANSSNTSEYPDISSESESE